MDASRLEPSDAFEVFAQWIARPEARTDAEFDALLRRHPSLAPDLETLRGAWGRLSSAGGGAASLRSVHEDVVERFGADADVQVSLHGESRGAAGATPADRLSEVAGRRGPLGRYEIEEPIARGGMGAIFRVWDADLRRRLAMKVALATLEGSPTDPLRRRGMARFLEEAQVTGQLDHPGIVPVHELGLDAEGRVYFTMKLVKGRDLKQVFQLVFEGREGWNETRAVGVLLKVCEAVAYAHEKGVVHRDLKPANVMVGNFGEVYVMDWGLARVLGEKDVHDLRLAESRPSSGRVRSDRRDEIESGDHSPLLTMAGDVVGTPAYMPPEQARGEIESLSPRSDVYSIGAMLYHLLARETPYASTATEPTHREVLRCVFAGSPKPIQEANPGVRPELAAICEKAMARRDEDRYPDTLALADDLRAYLEHRVVGAYETGAVAELKKWIGRNKPLASALAAAILALVAGLTASLVFQKRAVEKAAALETANGTIRETNAELTTARNVSEGKANDVLSLSAIQDLRDLEDRADALWPADPAHLAAYDAWLADARLLLDGRPADPAKGVKRRPGLAEHEAKLAEIRLRAKPPTPEEVEKDRRASPAYAEWFHRVGGRQWARRMLGDEPYPTEAEVQAGLEKESLPSDAQTLNGLAWPLVDTDTRRIVYGSEVRGLLLARRALAAASDPERAAIRDTLARALYRCGRFDDALAEQRRAVDEAEGKLKEEVSDTLTHMTTEIERWTTEAGRAKTRSHLQTADREIAELEKEIGVRRTYEFEDGEDRWWHEQLATLVSALRSFEDATAGGLFSVGTSRKHGWGIPERREFAVTIEERSRASPEASRRWSEAAAAIAASPKYGGLKLTRQLGLLPIGADPDSGLWEFAHLQSGEPPERGADGKLVVEESTAIVLVLIPGGTFRMGAQRADPAGWNYDPQARDSERPVHEVELSSFFLSKYEMTQGQWERFTGYNPSRYAPSITIAGHRYDRTHPVEQIGWTECRDALDRMSLALPTEAQWEYACRAGTSTPWWTGAERESLRGRVNIADQSVKRDGENWSEVEDWKDFDDGWVGHAPVGTFPANAFGLHEVHGNVWEWCFDGLDPAFYGKSKRLDPVQSGIGEGRIFRGGSLANTAGQARSSNRYEGSPEYKQFALGVRPARALDPAR